MIYTFDGMKRDGNVEQQKFSTRSPFFYCISWLFTVPYYIVEENLKQLLCL